MAAKPTSKKAVHIGVISDTHGLLRPEALDALRGSKLIIHAGDIGSPEVLKELRKIGPVVAVRGNNDKGDWAETLPETESIRAGRLLIHVLHNLNDLDLDPETAGFHVVISGHSHRPVIENKDGVLFLNPGSAGPRRFRLPVTVARLHVRNGKVDPRLVELI